MQITRQADYAVRAVLYLASLGEGGRAPTGQIARKQHVPPSFLAKIVSQLSVAGVLHTSRGAPGGRSPALPPRSPSWKSSRSSTARSPSTSVSPTPMPAPIRTTARFTTSGARPRPTFSRSSPPRTSAISWPTRATEGALPSPHSQSLAAPQLTPFSHLHFARTGRTAFCGAACAVPHSLAK